MTNPVDIPKVNAKNMTEKEFFYGHKACAGCGGSVAVRLALKVLGERTYTALPAGCMSAVGFIYPQMAFNTNALITTFPGAASMASGIAAGAKALGQKDVKTVVFAGDGGTADIGFQALSGMIDRNDDVLYICYDNEAYMNTGIQKSGLTPYGTKTTTTPAGENLPGTVTHKKNLFEIIAAHDIAYAATASIGYPQDFLNKVNKAKHIKGATFIHVYASCPTGWGTPTETSIEIAKEAVDCGLIFLAEYEDGEYKLNRNPKEFASVKDYLKKQGRFKHMNDADIKCVTENRDKKWARMRKNWL
ncbi:pyruvate synthase subunit beta [Labilibaculum sp. A4]|uniref:thiamine pyrophosphate-dependent enzyme n=1 Tax=Labilibaculum euxinus TaxID=2686357 RepID=UPI000F61AB9F|nr:thiamine pyrophosphate-dependent enzyme [Labilibaculum euxinus]MDQ1769949.1 thiamine pyrophosphate-dependent enzyme [Labilibaculum euxinus]MWN77371.1 pyruvate synthase subunit beta [Labilibaculum euxinus]